MHWRITYKSECGLGLVPRYRLSLSVGSFLFPLQIRERRMNHLGSSSARVELLKSAPNRTLPVYPFVAWTKVYFHCIRIGYMHMVQNLKAHENSFSKPLLKHVLSPRANPFTKAICCPFRIVFLCCFFFFNINNKQHYPILSSLFPVVGYCVLHTNTIGQLNLLSFVFYFILVE